MKRYTCFILLFFPVVMLFAQTKKASVSYSKYHTQKQLIEDLDTLVACLERYHPSLYAFQTPQEWKEHQVQTKQSLVDSMTALDAYAVFSSFIHKIRCGHTNIYPSEHISTWYPHYFKGLPINLGLLNDTIYVQHPHHTNIPKGSIVTKIGNYTSTEILKKLDTLVLNRDGNREDIFDYMFSDNMFSFFFANYSEDNYLIEYENYHTKLIQTDTITLDYFFLNRPKEKVEDFFSYKLLDNNVAVLTIKTFQNDQIKNLEPLWQRYFCEGLKTRIKQAFRQIKRDKVEHLIIDIRENEGGNPYLAYQICSYVFEEQFQYFQYFSINKKLPKKFYAKNMLCLDTINENDFYDKNQLHTYQSREPHTLYRNKLYMLIDDGTYSTGVQLAALLKYHKRATIIGQKTGGIADYCNAYQFVQYELPNTKTSGIIPIFKVPLAVHLSEKEGVKPDYFIHPTISDKVKKKDVELDFTLKLIEEKDHQHTSKTEK